MSTIPSCPVCGSEKVIKNGSIHNGKPKFSCKECRRQFVENSPNKIIPKETWGIVDKFLVEKISAAGISRVTGISEVWIQKYINKKYSNILRKSMAVLKNSRLILQCDELWSFVGSKKKKVWIWLALDTDSRKIAGAHVGSRSRKGASGLWRSIPHEIKKMLFFILIHDQPIKEFFLSAVIFLSERKAVKQVILNGSILLCASASHVLKKNSFIF